jgi:hypothetical protein
LLFLWTPFLFVLPQAARAEKGSRCPAAIHLFPASGSVVPRNVRLVLEGSGAERQRVLGLIGQDVLLKSEDDVVTAKVLRGWVSAKGPAAVVLRPRAWLKPNRVYRLLLDRVLPDFDWTASRRTFPIGASASWPTKRPLTGLSVPLLSKGRPRPKATRLFG